MDPASHRTPPHATRCHTSMRTIPLTVLIAVAVGGCGTGARPRGGDPAIAATESAALVRDALRVWRLGAAAWRPRRSPELANAPNGEPREDEGGVDEEWGMGGASPDSPPLQRLNARASGFLDSPFLAHAVHFGCCHFPHDTEDWVQAALNEALPARRLLALTMLVKVKAPRSVPEQWTALEGLTDLPALPECDLLLAELRDVFSEEVLEKELDTPLSEATLAPAYAQECACRAVGVRRHWRLLSRLAELSRVGHLHVSLAAERSIEDFPGREGDAALVTCILGWRGDAAWRAARALMERDPDLLRRALLQSEAPPGGRRLQALLLGRLGEAAAVPLICEGLPEYEVIDREMLDLVERLASGEHLHWVDALPGSVCEARRARAEQVRRNVRSRLGLAAE